VEWKIKESMLQIRSVCVDRPYGAGNPVKVDLAGGDIGIY